MSKYIQQIASFYKRNRLMILSGAALLVVLQWCQVQADKKYRQPGVAQPSAIDAPVSAPMPDPSLNDAPAFNPWLPYLLMVGLTLLFFVAQRRGWLAKLFPKVIVLRIKIFAMGKRHMLRIFFMNSKKENQSFEAPVVEFLKPGKNKAYKIIVTDSEATFPLVLTPTSAHSLLIDLERFYEKMPDLRKYHWIRIKLTVNGKKEVRSFPRPIWSSFFRK